MAGRMSNRDRIAQKQAEADAASKEKEAANAAPKPAKSAATAKSKPKAKKAPARIKIVWAVCEPTGSHAKYYPYAQENEAIADAKQRTESTGKTHFVTKAEVPLE